jgi:hypothetical protein
MVKIWKVTNLSEIDDSELISENEWIEKRNSENESSTHPCDYWFPSDCMCKGACSCHWKQER